MRLPLAGGFAQGRAKSAAGSSLINFLVEPPSQPGLEPYLIGTPGFLNVTQGTIIPVPPHAAQVRGLKWLGEGSLAYRDFLFVVVGNRCYTWDPLGGWTDLNAANRLGTTTGPVDISFNGPTGGIWVSTGAELFIIDLPGGTAQNAFGRFGLLANGSNTCDFSDGYLVCDDRANSGRFYYSDLYNAVAINGFNFSTAEAAVDRLVATRMNRRELWLLGETTTEIFMNAGGSDNPWQRFQGGFLEVGCALPLTARVFDGSMTWVTRDRNGDLQVARAGEGYQPEIISTPELSYAWRNYRTQVSGGLGLWGYYGFAHVVQIGGHELYVLTFTNIDGSGGRATWVFDARTKLWGVWRTGTGMDHMLQAMCFYGSTLIGNADGQILIGDSAATGKIFAVSEDYGSEDGAIITRERTMPALPTQKKRSRITAVEIDFGESSNQISIVSTNVAGGGGAIGGTSLQLASLGTAAIGDNATIDCDNGARHHARITALPGGSVITFANQPLPAPVSAGNNVRLLPRFDADLTYSKDGSANFTTQDTDYSLRPIYPLPSATQGATLLRALWRKLGSAREWIFRLRVVGTAAPVTVIQALAHIAGEEGTP